MQKHFIFFDFDGVIADSFKTAFSVYKKICPQLTEDNYRKRFEGNINNWEDPANYHTEDCRHNIDFFTEYIPKMKKEVVAFPGIKEVIIELEKNYELIVVSSTITSPILEFLESHGLADHFRWIMGNDVHKSKVEKIKMVFSKYEVGAENCVFVTDTLGDMREAQEVNVGVIGVTWGFQDHKTLLKGNPVYLAEKPRDLIVNISDYFSEKSTYGN